MNFKSEFDRCTFYQRTGICNRDFCVMCMQNQIDTLYHHLIVMPSMYQTHTPGVSLETSNLLEDLEQVCKKKERTKQTKHGHIHSNTKIVQMYDPELGF